jgi:cytochrome bd-type quinol oxidase subunit 2
MQTIYNYLEVHKRLRATLLCVLFCIASVALFMVSTAWIFIGLPGATADTFRDVVYPSTILILALVCDLGITWMLHRPERRRFWSTFAWVSAAVFLGMILVSVVAMRESWLEIMKELFRYGPAFMRRG